MQPRDFLSPLQQCDPRLGAGSNSSMVCSVSGARENSALFRHTIGVILKLADLDLCQWDSEVSIKSLNFKDTLQKKIEHASYGHV